MNSMKIKWGNIGSLPPDDLHTSSFSITVPEDLTVWWPRAAWLQKAPKKRDIHTPLTLSEDSEMLILLRLIPIPEWLTFLKYLDAERRVLQLSGKCTYMEEMQVISIFFFFWLEPFLYLSKVKRKKVQELQKKSLSDLCLISKCNICMYTSLKTQKKACLYNPAQL